MSNQNNHFGLLKILPMGELEEALQLTAEEKTRIFISGYADYTSQHFVLFRADGTIIVAAFSMFKENETNTPNFQDYEIMDFGHTLRLGKYLASTRSILYELDPECRKYYDSIKIKINLNIN